MNTWACILVILFGMTLGQDTGLGSTGSQVSSLAPSLGTSKSPTTTTSPQTTTTAPQTTTTTPKTTTTAPKTTTTTPKTTTTAPKTTTKPPKTTTTATPSTQESLNNYNVTKKGEICLLATFKGHFKGKKTWNIGSDAKVLDESNCGKLAVDFDDNDFVLSFNQTDKKHFYIETIKANLSGTVYSKSGLDIAKAANGSSYMCKSGITVDMGQNITFTMTDLQVQAYWVGKEGKYATATDCNSDLSPIVPIIVGAILAGLVIIVVVAYFIGRNRNRVGYEEI